jgi:hypothetical protein
MRTRQGLALDLIVSTTALTGACAEERNPEATPAPGNTASDTATATPASSWEARRTRKTPCDGPHAL